MFHAYENFIISAGAKHKSDDSDCRCNEEIRKTLLLYTNSIKHKVIFGNFYDDQPMDLDDEGSSITSGLNIKKDIKVTHEKIRGTDPKFMTKHLKHTSNGTYGKCIIALTLKD